MGASLGEVDLAPANNQPLLSDGKKLTIGGLAVAGLFLLCFGAGESTVVIAGLGVLVGLGGPTLIIVTTSRAAKRTYVFGTAHVHDVSGLPTAGNTGRIQMQLIINARGIDGVPVMMRDNSVPANKWPDVGATLPVRVLETNPSKVTVLWDQVRTHGEVSRGEQRYPGFSPPAPREEPDPVAAPSYVDDDRHAIADEDDYDDGPLPPDDRPTRADLPPIRVDEPSGGGSPVAVMDRQQVVEISPTPGSSYPGYPYEDHVAYSPTYPAQPTSPPDESDISPYDLTPQDLPAASAASATSTSSAEQAPPRVSSRRRPSPYRRKPGNRPSTRPTASAPFRTGTPEDEAADPDWATAAPAQDTSAQDTPDLLDAAVAPDTADLPSTAGLQDAAVVPDAAVPGAAVPGAAVSDAAGPGAAVSPDAVVTSDAAVVPDAALVSDYADMSDTYVTSRETDESPESEAPHQAAPEDEALWATRHGGMASAIPATADRETDWAPSPRPQTVDSPFPTDTDPAAAPSARETAWAEIDQPTPAGSTTDWPDPAARETALAEPASPGTTTDPGQDTDWPDPADTGRGAVYNEPVASRDDTEPDQHDTVGTGRETRFAEPAVSDWADATPTGREAVYNEPADPRPDWAGPGRETAYDEPGGSRHGTDWADATDTGREAAYDEPTDPRPPADWADTGREAAYDAPAGSRHGADQREVAGDEDGFADLRGYTDWADDGRAADWAEATDTGWPEPAAPEAAGRGAVSPEPASPSGPEVLEGDVGWPEPTGRAEPPPPRSAWNNGWARTVWPHRDRPETAPEEPDLPDGLDSDAEALEGGVFDPSGYATDSPDDAAAHVETMDDSYAMPAVYGIPEGGADIYVPDPYVSETYDPEPDRPAKYEEMNGHAVEIVAPPTEPYRPADTARQPSPIDELLAPWPEPAQRSTGPAPDDEESGYRADHDAPEPEATTDTVGPHPTLGAAQENTATGITTDGPTTDGPTTDAAPDGDLAADDDPTVGAYLADEDEDQYDDAVARSGRTSVEVDPADALEPEPDDGQVARFLAAGPKEAVLPVTNPSVQGISVTLQVSDLQRSRRFYKEKLGLQELDSSLSSAVLLSGEARVLLRQVAHMQPVDRRTVHLHLEVPDVYEAYERLRAEGVEFVHRPRVVPQGEQLDLCTATFRDPDGHAVELSRWELRR